MRFLWGFFFAGGCLPSGNIHWQCLCPRGLHIAWDSPMAALDRSIRWQVWNEQTEISA